MTKPVYANGRQILHAGDGHVHVCAPPDVCKTPSPGGPPVPVPYVNSAATRDLKKGSKRTKIGNKSIAIEGASIGTSTGDEPGNAGGGLMSSKSKGAMTWQTTSPNVRVEGKPVARFMDVTMHNGNTFNTAFQSAGHTGFAYADDFDGLCPICSEGPEMHRILEHESTVLLADRLISRLRDARKRGGAKPVTRKGMGYMVAMMKCHCKQVWAAMSGPRTTPGFVEVASGVATSTGHVANGGAVSADDMWALNQSQYAESSRAEFDAAWDAAFENSRERVDGYRPPGQCAAAKVLKVSAGHKPLAMTERYFAAKKPWGPRTYRFRQTEISQQDLMALGEGARKMVFRNILASPDSTRTFRATPDFVETVGSCHTCQELLYMVMCEAPPCA